MTSILCDECRSRPAVILQPHTGKRLCMECFRKSLLERVQREIKRWRMFEPGRTKLLLALSGGKDSLTLLDLMVEIHDVNRMHVVTVYEGAGRGYRIREIENLVKIARSYGVEVTVTSIKEWFGLNLAELAKAAMEAGISPCTVCGTLRRRIINTFARQHGFERVATAHNLDDESQTLIMNILRGDLTNLLRMHPASPTLSKLFIPRVKPLRKIYEWETAAYAYLRGWSLPVESCPLITEHGSLRAVIREYLYKVEWEKPGTLLRMMESFDSMFERHAKNLSKLPELPLCEKCGEPTSHGRRLCRVCEILEKISRPLSLAEPLHQR